MTPQLATTSRPSARNLVPTTAAAIGVALLALFAAQIWRWHAMNQATDTDYLYLGAWAWRHGLSPYGHIDRSFTFSLMGVNSSASLAHPGYFYPPACAMIFAPLTLLPYPMARTLFTFGEFAVLFAALWHFSRLVFPALTPHWRVLALGLISLTPPLNWLRYWMQPSALFIALLILFACAAINRRWTASTIIGALITLKLSFILPVVGLLVWQRKFGVLAAIALAAISLNLIATLPTGTRATLTDYAARIHEMQAPDSIDYPSALGSISDTVRQNPQSPLYAAVSTQRTPRTAAELQFSFAYSAFTRSPRAIAALTVASDTLIIALTALILWRFRANPANAPPDRPAALFCLLIGASLLTVYHGRYDIAALTPAIFVAAARTRSHPRSALAWTWLAATLLATAWPLTPMATLATNAAVNHGWLWLVQLPTYVVLAQFVLTIAIGWRRAVTIHLPQPLPRANGD